MPDVRVKVAGGGAVVIPAEYRRALGVRVGDEVILRLEGGQLWIRSPGARRGLELPRRSLPTGRSPDASR